MNNFIELNLKDSCTSLTEVDNQPYLKHVNRMKTKATASIKKFKFRIAPHEIMKSEYPELYYKFRNEKVATAFFQETLGHEILPQQLKILQS